MTTMTSFRMTYTRGAGATAWYTSWQ